MTITQKQFKTCCPVIQSARYKKWIPVKASQMWIQLKVEFSDKWQQFKNMELISLENGGFPLNGCGQTEIRHPYVWNDLI